MGGDAPEWNPLDNGDDEDNSVVGDMFQTITQPWTIGTDRNMTDRWGLTYAEDTTEADAQKRAAAAAKAKEKRTPNLPDANLTAIGTQVKDQRRRSASRTLLTGGSGVLDSAPTASTTLLGL